jgi:hypothetical protein
MKKVHLAVSVANLDQSIAEYTAMLGLAPELIIPEQYALWRTEILNLSIRVTGQEPGLVRHVGFEDLDAQSFTVTQDCNGLSWERFHPLHQAQEIAEAWPGIEFRPKEI